MALTTANLVFELVAKLATGTGPRRLDGQPTQGGCGRDTGARIVRALGGPGRAAGRVPLKACTSLRQSPAPRARSPEAGRVVHITRRLRRRGVAGEQPQAQGPSADAVAAKYTPDAVRRDPQAASLLAGELAGDVRRSVAGVTEGKGDVGLLDEHRDRVRHLRMAALLLFEIGLSDRQDASPHLGET